MNKELLIDEYINKKKPMHQIARENSIAVGTVFNMMKKYDIPSRERMSHETKEKISKSLKARPFTPRGTMSDYQRKRISEGKKGKYLIHSKYGGHTKKRSDGYISVYVPEHPRSNKDGYVMEHVLVMENHIGRHLTNGEIVHHKNKIRDDNRVDNLQIMTKSEHARFHNIERHMKMRGVMAYQ